MKNHQLTQNNRTNKTIWSGATPTWTDGSQRSMSIADTRARQFWLNASERQGTPTTSRNVHDTSI
eukprot:11168308-Lingulodinium_polyedra.AAC.1